MPFVQGKPSLHIIVDGYNLIRNVPALAQYEGRSLQDGRDHLIARLAAYRAASGHRVTVVFDGPGAVSDSRRGVVICYAQPADDDIVRRAGPGCVVVSSDHAVMNGAKARGAEAMRSDAFWDVATKHQGVAAPVKRKSGGRGGAPLASGTYGKDEDDDDYPQQNKRGPSRRMSKKDKEEADRRRRLENRL